MKATGCLLRLGVEEQLWMDRFYLYMPPVRHDAAMLVTDSLNQAAMILPAERRGFHVDM